MTAKNPQEQDSNIAQKSIRGSKKEKAPPPVGEYAIYDTQVKKQGYPIFKVVSKGVCIEYTDRISQAEQAYKETSCPKEMYRLTKENTVCLRHQLF